MFVIQWITQAIITNTLKRVILRNELAIATYLLRVRWLEMQWSKEKITNRQPIVDKTLSGKLKIDQHESHYKPSVNSDHEKGCSKLSTCYH